MPVMKLPANLRKALEEYKKQRRLLIRSYRRYYASDDLDKNKTIWPETELREMLSDKAARRVANLLARTMK